MHEILRAVWHSRFVAFSCALAFFLAAAATLLPYYLLASESVPRIVHFSESGGIDRVGALWDIMEIGIFGIAMVAVNSLIVFELEKRKLFWAKFLALGTLFLSALIFIGVLAIISVN